MAWKIFCGFSSTTNLLLIAMKKATTCMITDTTDVQWREWWLFWINITDFSASYMWVQVHGGLISLRNRCVLYASVTYTWVYTYGMCVCIPLAQWLEYCIIKHIVMITSESGSKSVVLNLGSIEPQGFLESVSGILQRSRILRLFSTIPFWAVR